MKHLQKFNESANEKPHLLVRIFEAMGFIVSDDGVVTTTNRFAKFLYEMAVRDGEFIKDGDKYKLSEDYKNNNPID